ncbi:MAG: hypothetical protein AAB152_01460 [Candidatus Coatesbacteria bacterium]|mgnify:CR=1 FL=1
MRRMHIPLLAGVVVLSGCGSTMDYMLMRPSAELPGPMQTTVQLTTSGKADLQYEVLGMGTGSSSGFVFLMGIIGNDADVSKAYDDAVRSLNGDFLINANKQVKKSGFFAPLLFGSYTVKVTGLVAKIRR